MSPRLLVVEGLTGRLEVEGKLDGDVNGAQANGSHANGDSDLRQGTKGSQGAAQPKSEKQPWHEVITLNERRIGAYSRHFTFACDVDNKALRAKLRDGLLSIAVPKVKQTVKNSCTFLSIRTNSPVTAIAGGSTRTSHSRPWG